MALLAHLWVFRKTMCFFFWLDEQFSGDFDVFVVFTRFFEDTLTKARK